MAGGACANGAIETDIKSTETRAWIARWAHQRVAVCSECLSVGNLAGDASVVITDKNVEAVETAHARGRWTWKHTFSNTATG
jgi:hypothetical protein